MSKLPVGPRALPLSPALTRPAAVRIGAVLALAAALPLPALLAAQSAPTFDRHELATGIRGGYQVVIADFDKDGHDDLLAVGTGNPDLLWFRNPAPAPPGTAWEPNVIASGLPAMINAAVRDLDGDGIPEIALAYGFSTAPPRSAGNVAILTHQGDPTQPWSVREIDRVPSAHRLRWVDTGPVGGVVLVNAPLAGATSTGPEYRGKTPIYYYRPDDWTRRVVTEDDEGVVHGIQPVRWPGERGELLVSASFLGIHLHRLEDGGWSRQKLASGDPAPWPDGGSSDVDLGTFGTGTFLAAIEPWHGNQVVVYHERPGSGWTRQVLDAEFDEGHTLVTADFDGDGNDEIVAGARRGRRVSLYRADAALDGAWTRTDVDTDGMAAAGCAAGDLDGDGRTDLVCLGTATANLVWYRNAGAR